MSAQRYRLLFNPIFEKDLDEITDYISIHLQNPEAALRLVDDLENAIYRRLGTPLAFAPYPSSKARPHPYYRMNARNYSVFYVVIEDTMEVRRVLYARRNLDKLLP